MVHIGFSPSSVGKVFFLLAGTAWLGGGGLVVHYSNNLCKFRRLLFLFRCYGAHLHSRYTVILPSALDSSNNVQRSMWRFNVLG